MHVRAQPETYEIKLFADMRKFFFKPAIETRLMEKLKSFLWSYFNKMQAQSDPRCNSSNIRFVEERDEHRESSSGFQLQDGIDFDINQSSMLGPKEKAIRKLNQRIKRNLRVPTDLGMGVLKHISSHDLNQAKQQNLLLSEMTS